MSKQKIDHLVVDTSAFIQQAQLQDIAKNFYTVQEVVDEITNKRQLRRLCVLPYDLKVKHVYPEHIATVTEFSKKTGDYKSLSATDIKVMALTLQLQKEYDGDENIRKEPVYKKIVNYTKDKVEGGDNLPGFYFPKKTSRIDEDKEKENTADNEQNDKKEIIENTPGEICEAQNGVDEESDKEENDKQEKDKQEKDTQKNDKQEKDTQKKDKQEKDTQKKDTQENDKQENDAQDDDAQYQDHELNNDLIERFSDIDLKKVERIYAEYIHQKIPDVDKRIIDYLDNYNDDGWEKIKSNRKSKKSMFYPQSSKDNSVDKEVFSKGEIVSKEITTNEDYNYSCEDYKYEDILSKCEIEEDNSDDYTDCSDSDFDEEENDDDDWITPENVEDAIMQTKGLMGQYVEDIPVKVACMTKDFAMQNVLKQMNLNISVLNGLIIKQLRTYIFRCYSCFKTTSVMTNVFCPKCGYATLKRVSVCVDGEGKQVIHINVKRPISKRGKKFSLPTPQGGKHANNPILSADQPVPDQRPSRLARTKTNVLADDYVTGYSPFVTRDVNSRSALLGIKNKPQQIKHWMRKNPNEARRKRK